MKPLVRRTYSAYPAPLDRAMCFSSSRLPVCLTSMFVIFKGQATSTRPSIVSDESRAARVRIAA